MTNPEDLYSTISFPDNFGGKRFCESICVVALKLSENSIFLMYWSLQKDAMARK